jgi:hypothetical protein
VYRHKFLEDVHEDSMQFPSQNNRFLCNRPDGPLKASGSPVVSRSFSVEDVRTSELHRPDASSSLSSFYKELDFMFRHRSGNSNRPDGRATPSRNISGFSKDLCTCLNVFIITLCSSIGLRRSWCRWKAQKK